jgi:hypothetical protein
LLSLKTGAVDSHAYMLALRSRRLMLNCDLGRLRE